MSTNGWASRVRYMQPMVTIRSAKASRVLRRPQCRLYPMEAITVHRPITTSWITAPVGLRMPSQRVHTPKTAKP